MARSLKKIMSTFSLKRNRNKSSGTKFMASPTAPSPQTGGHATSQEEAAAVTVQQTAPSPTDPGSIPTQSVNHTQGPNETSTFRRAVQLWRVKITTTLTHKHSKLQSTQPSTVPELSDSRRIGPEMLVPSLTSAGPLHEVSPLVAEIESSSSGDVDLSQAKTALRLLSSVGDGVTGVPWLKSVAGLGMEIVNVLDTAQSNKSDCRDLAVRIRQFLVLIVDDENDAEPQYIVDFRENLHTILHSVKNISSSNNSFRRFFKADDIKQKIFKCNQLLNDSRDIFLVAAHVALAAQPVKQVGTAEIKSPPNLRSQLSGSGRDPNWEETTQRIFGNLQIAL